MITEMHDLTLLDSQKETASFDSMAFEIVDSRMLNKAKLQEAKDDPKITQL